MSTATHAVRTSGYGIATAPARQVVWTRLGNALGYTNTEAKRAEIRAAVEHMTWRGPADLAHVLTMAPARQVIASLFYGRSWALDLAAVTTLADDAIGQPRLLIGLHAVTGQQHVLLHIDYEVVELLHDSPITAAVTR